MDDEFIHSLNMAALQFFPHQPPARCTVQAAELPRDVSVAHPRAAVEFRLDDLYRSFGKR